MQAVNWRKDLKHLYGPSANKVVEVEVPEMRFLMVDGTGDPNADGFRGALEAIYAVSYAVKFMVRKRVAVDYGVSPAEGLWWGGEEFEPASVEEAWRLTAASRESWHWTLMVMQPEPVTGDLFEEARDRVASRKRLPAVAGLRLEAFREGRSAQILHRGPYADEWPTIHKVHDFIEEQGATPTGKHHEIYLNNPSRTAPQNLKTIIRQPCC